MTTNQQLELGLKHRAVRLAARRRESRAARARWWFAQMREAVQNAIALPDAGQPQPEQIWMTGARREVKV